MSNIKRTPFIGAADRRDSLTRLQNDASKTRASNDMASLAKDVVEARGPIMTGCKEGTDKEKDKEKEKEREVHQQDYFRSIPKMPETASVGTEGADQRLATGILVF